MPGRTPRGTATKVARRQRSLAGTALLAAIAGLALVAVVTASTFLARVLDLYTGGMLLGAGTVAVAWGVSAWRRRLGERERRNPGRSRTLDCHRARWHRPRPPLGQPHFPVPADRRVVPCRNSRFPGR